MICKSEKDLDEKVNSSDIKKHKKDVLRIASELMLEKVEELPTAVDADIHSFIDLLEQEPFLRMILCENKPGYARKQKFIKAYKARNTKKN